MSNTALIITDGTSSIENISRLISGELNGVKVKICSAKDFAGTDLLPADIFFIGCEFPSPSSFSYLEQMLKHINLASRKCGVFSVNFKTLKYLCNLVKDCEADLGAPLHVASKEINKTKLNKWINSVIN
ncbi:MAG: hypothetical protein FWD13_01665 [Treponema sp.]|nr:hypothetical protein [Treponema sp.]